VDLLELAVVLPHLAPERVLVLDAAGDLHGEAPLDEHRVQAAGDVGDVLVAVTRGALDLPAHLREVLRPQVLEAEVLELALEPEDPEAPGQRRVDVQGLPADPLAALVLHVVERPHVVQAVAELDHQHPDVPGHGHEHLAEALGLLVFLVVEVDAAELGDPVDEEGDLLAEALLDVLEGRLRVLHHVVHERGGHARGVELHLRDHRGHARRVHEVGVAGLAQLPVVHRLGVEEGVGQEVDVDVRLVLAHLRQDRGEARVLEAGPAGYVLRVRADVARRGALRRRGRRRSLGVLAHAIRPVVASAGGPCGPISTSPDPEGRCAGGEVEPSAAGVETVEPCGTKANPEDTRIHPPPLVTRIGGAWGP
jgi:hypothetical protein